MHNIQPIRLLPARERVASVLRKAILSRELAEGEALALESIASQLGVSNTPVREAFQILAREGLIRLRPNKGAEVMGISAKMIRDHYETRAILERECAAMVCRSGADISAIEKAHLDSMAALEAGDHQSYTNYNQSFHFELWTAAGNEKITALLSEMWNGLSMGLEVSEKEYAKISVAEHKKIVAALKTRDADHAGRVMYEHIVRSMNNMLTRFE